MAESRGTTRMRAAHRLVSYNPATGAEIGSVAVSDRRGVEEAVTRARAAQREWAELGLGERARVVRRAADYLVCNAERYARLITDENGKPTVEAYVMEVIATVEAFRYVARFGPKILATERLHNPQLAFRHKRHELHFEPIGVVGIIAPWNYPLSIPAGQIAAALVAGDGVVLKPAPLTPLVGESIKEAFLAAGLPDDLLVVVHGDAEAGQAMCVSEGIGKIVFTGSVEVGREVAEVCARLLKPVTLELGGKDAAIVRADADLERASTGVLWGGTANAGQTCSGIERVYVDRRVAHEFLARLVAKAKALRCGDPRDPRTQVGPMTSAEQYTKVVALVEDAVSRGASILCGGPADTGLAGSFYSPAVLVDVRQDMPLMREELFGPVVPVMAFASEEEAVALANDSDFGLGASVWTRDMAAARRIAGHLEAGSVWVNDHMYSHAAYQTPWGGVKRSGVGITHSRFGFYELCHVKHISFDTGRIPVPFWYPYDERLLRGLKAALRAMYSPGPGASLRVAIRERKALAGLASRMGDMRKGRI
ncbi:MAG: aldehyde dehydrogenase family protein [Actinomycetota bacterium]